MKTNALIVPVIAAALLLLAFFVKLFFASITPVPKELYEQADVSPLQVEEKRERRFLSPVTPQDIATTIERYYRFQNWKRDVLEEARRKEAELKRAMSGNAARLYEQGLLAMQNREIDRALELFAAAIKAEPDNYTIKAVALRQMIKIFLVTGKDLRRCQAIYSYLEAMEKMEKDPAELANLRALKDDVRKTMLKLELKEH